MRESVIQRFRSRWLEWMTDTVTVTAPSARVYNRGTGSYDTTAGASRYSGVARAFFTGTTRQVDIGEQERDVRQFELILPYDTTGIIVDDVVTVTVSEDSELTGVTGRVTHVEVGGWNETRRLHFEETL